MERREVVAEHVKLIREYNPLIYDFIIKRHLQVEGHPFDNAAFETARIFRCTDISI